MTFREEVIDVLAGKAAQIYKREKSEFGPGTRFAEDLQAKSVNYVQFTAELEDVYEVEVPFAEFKRKKTFEEAADYIAELLGQD
jgi:acyl carrier protein